MNITLIAPYTESHEALAEQFAASFQDTDIPLELIQLPTVGSGGGNFQSDSWRNAVTAKQSLIVEKINAHRGEILVCSDVGIQFFRPIRPFIEAAMRDPKIDMAFQREQATLSGGYNAGFIAIRCNPKVLELYRAMCESDLLSEPLPDQDWFNRHLDDFPIVHAPLPPEIWAWSHGRETITREIALHHANCTCSGDSINEKLHQLEMVRHYLSDRRNQLMPT